MLNVVVYRKLKKSVGMVCTYLWNFNVESLTVLRLKFSDASFLTIYKMYLFVR
jgi:hypothetical protein